MMIVDKEDKIREIVADVLHQAFGDDVEFGPIYVDFDVDEDGLKYVMANVIYRSDNELLDAGKTLDVIEPIRHRIEELEEPAFPVLSFIAKSEEEDWLGDRPRLD